MKTLLLMRHAKSSWKHPDLPDQDRPLNKRGEKDAPRMGKYLKEKELVPQVILASPAKRIKQTVDGVLEKMPFKGKVEYVDSLYLAEPTAYFSILQTIPDKIERVLIVGHNPGLEGLLQILSGQVESLPTASIAHLVLPIEHWKDLKEETRCELVERVKPRDLK
ncbi:MAG: histidine phosphatase family protein [Chloroflexi bacterium]|jgi:phosphohistidine phosphatase|nr:histidine phosphatase family protein [Chloroflexota bacterium]BCY16759.1 phosphoglycerate mutase [Leptolinea sp. HRD-7]